MYDVKSVLMKLIESDNWGEYAPLVDELKATSYWDIFYDALVGLKRDALYSSPVHGEGHIERVLLHGAFCALSELLSEADARLLMDMCSYHDAGRANDWLDNAHGLRSAMKLERLTGRTGEELKIMKIGVEAHSLGDGALDEIIDKHAPLDRARAKRLAELLKDADGLDRVRIRDLDVKYLRRQNSRSRAGFAQYLFDRYAELDGERAADEFRDGFELATVLAVKSSIAKGYAEGLSCAQVMLLCLGGLCGVAISEQLLQACAGLGGPRFEAAKSAGTGGASPEVMPASKPRCGLVDAALLFIGVYFGGRGRAKDDVGALCAEYLGHFAAQYVSDDCREIRRAVGATHGCESLAVDAALHAFRFINEKDKKNK